MKTQLNLSTLTLTMILSLTSPSYSQTQIQEANLPQEIDFPRLSRMSYLLHNYSQPNWDEYKKLCSQAKTEPKLNMTLFEARNSTWCFPYERHITKTIQGEFVQEVYLKRNSNGESDSRYSKRLYLYFTNNILTTIQE